MTAQDFYKSRKTTLVNVPRVGHPEGNMKRRYKLVNIGRGKVTRSVECTENQLIREVSKHLGSSGVDIEWDDDSQCGSVLVGGFRKVGEVYLEQ